MTEKRYVSHFHGYIVDCKQKQKMLDRFEVTDLLNKYDIENKQLKSENKELKQDNDIKFWKLQLMKQWNKTQIITHELSLAMDKGYQVSDEFKAYIDELRKNHEEHIKKIERLGLDD